MELVLDHLFLYGADQRDYVEGRGPLSFDEIPSVTVSTVCQDLITGLLAPNAQSRPTVKDVISHSWFATATDVLGEEAS
jgi:serine/threonine protein kinase